MEREKIYSVNHIETNLPYSGNNIKKIQGWMEDGTNNENTGGIAVLDNRTLTYKMKEVGVPLKMLYLKMGVKLTLA